MTAEQKDKKVGTCHACGGTVSKTAKSCPHCGEKKPYRGKDRKAGLGTWIIVIIAFFIMMGQITQMMIPSKERVARQNGLSGYGTEAEARQKCEKAIRASVNNPSTVDIQSVVGYGSNVDETGTRRITQSFSAKNSFGLKQTYDAYCSVTSDGTFDFKVQEQGK